MKKRLLFALIMGLAFTQSAYASCHWDDAAASCVHDETSDSTDYVNPTPNLDVDCGSNPQMAGNVDKSFGGGGGSGSGGLTGFTAYGGSARGAGG